MADVKITALTAISSNPVNPATFPIPMVDLLDTSMAASGTTKKVTVNQILGAGGTATLASATITGAATVGTTLGVTGASTLTGNVSVGTTLSAWGGNSKVVEVGVGSAVSSTGAGTTSSRFTHGCYFDNTNWKYQYTSVGATLYEVTGANSGSTHAWYVAPGGTAGNTVTAFTAPAMTLSYATGNLAFPTGKGIDFSAVTGGTGTATANVLNDYEEGTWTIGLAFGGASVGLTTSSSTGRYTKVGRQVTVTGLLVLTSKGSSTGGASVTGLPFSIGNSNDSYPAASLRLNGISYVGAFQAFGTIGSTFISFEQISTLGAVASLTDANFTNASSFIFTLTYFV